VIRPTQSFLPNNTPHSQEADIHALGGIEPTIPGSERLQTDALNRATAGMGQTSTVPQQIAEAHNGL